MSPGEISRSPSRRTVTDMRGVATSSGPSRVWIDVIRVWTPADPRQLGVQDVAATDVRTTFDEQRSSFTAPLRDGEGEIVLADLALGPVGVQGDLHAHT
jgi:hypothetical protein